MIYKIIIAGFGGQGVLFAGKVLAQAAVLGGYEVTWLPSYGPEMRGGTANCQLIISDRQIGSPVIKEADVLIAMNLPSLMKFKDSVQDLIITDERFITGVGTKSGTVEVIALNTDICNGGAQFEGLMNMIMIGALARRCDLFDTECLHRAIELTAKQNAAKIDISAVNYGWEKAKIKAKIVS